MQDLKTGWLVGATPWKQQIALIFGCLVGAVVMPFVLNMLYHAYGFTGALPKSVYEKDTAMFEGHEFCIPKGYDAFLSAFFGDYMTIPKEEDRVTHKFTCYRIEE